MVLIQTEQDTQPGCDDCAVLIHLLSQPKRADIGRTAPVHMDAATFAAALWASVPCVRSAHI